MNDCVAIYFHTRKEAKWQNDRNHGGRQMAAAAPRSATTPHL